jgi:hypothetical protein
MSKWRDKLARLGKAFGTRDRASEPIACGVHDHPELTEIERVTFYKRDEVTTDLICCDVEARGKTWVYHEEAEGWDDLLRRLEQLPTFRPDWYQAVVHPPFAACETVAFRKD